MTHILEGFLSLQDIERLEEDQCVSIIAGGLGKVEMTIYNADLGALLAEVQHMRAIREAEQTEVTRLRTEVAHLEKARSETLEAWTRESIIMVKAARLLRLAEGWIGGSDDSTEDEIALGQEIAAFLANPGLP